MGFGTASVWQNLEMISDGTCSWICVGTSRPRSEVLSFWGPEVAINCKGERAYYTVNVTELANGYNEVSREMNAWVVYSASDLRGFWFPLNHAELPGVELLELTPVDLCEPGVETEVTDVEEIVNPIPGAEVLLPVLSSAISAEVMLLELRDAPSVLWS